MAEEQGSTGRWLRRITDTLSGEPRDLDDLIETLTQARERGLINSDAFEMLEGVLRVAELQVRDIMVPRSQMTIVNRDDPPEDILPVVIESGHSRFPVIGEDRDQIVGILLAKDLLRYFAEGGREDFDIKEVPAPGRVHSGEQAPQRAAQGVPRQPSPHGDRRRRVRRRLRPGHDRRRARADRRRHRR